jgi:hypothetical protein
MANRQWDEIDEEMAKQGHFEDVSRKQQIHRPLGRGPAKTRRGQARGEDKIANRAARRVMG